MKNSRWEDFSNIQELSEYYLASPAAIQQKLQNVIKEK